MNQPTSRSNQMRTRPAPPPAPKLTPASQPQLDNGVTATEAAKFNQRRDNDESATRRRNVPVFALGIATAAMLLTAFVALIVQAGLFIEWNRQTMIGTALVAALALGTVWAFSRRSKHKITALVSITIVIAAFAIALGLAVAFGIGAIQ